LSAGIPYSPTFFTGSDLVSPIEKGIPMKGSKSLVAIAIATILAITPSAIAAPKTTLKAAGRVVTTVVNTILSGPAIPTKAIGIDGDFYIDTKNANLYGPKTKGVWKIATSLKQTDTKSVTTVIGEQGGMGATGPQGEKGDKGATGSTGAAGSNGFTGATGATGATGLTGAKGNDGATGVSGVAGSIGVAGAVGATGAKGDTGLTGAKGDAGTAGAKGDTGLTGGKGDAGTAGAKGDAGTAGISNAKFNAFNNISINTGTSGISGTSTFLTTTAAGNYEFQILISGEVGQTNDLNFTAEIYTVAGVIGNQFSVSSAAPIIFFGSPGRRFSLVVTGVAANVEIGTVFGVRVTLATATTPGYVVSFSGRALINTVGSIG
jgi:hypothetical protein